MEDIKPAVFCPFQPQTNPHIDSARTHLDSWVSKHGLVRTRTSRHRFVRADFGGFASVTYPSADEQCIHLVSDWFAWLFLVDDELDDGVAGRNLSLVEQVMNEILGVLCATDSSAQSESTGDVGGSAIDSLVDLWQRTRARSTAAWRSRFTQHVSDCFAAACWEAENRIRKSVPDEQTYLGKRRDTGAIYICMDLIEIAENSILQAEIVDSGVFRDTRNAACNVVCWTNDVYSLEKERNRGEAHNLVYIVEHARGLTSSEALAYVSRIISAETQRYLIHEQRLLNSFPDHSREIRRYAAGMRSWMRGNLDWSRRTYRYRDEYAPGMSSTAGYLEPTLLRSGVGG